MSRPRDDRDRLVAVAVAGFVAHARIDADVVDARGQYRLLPASGGIAEDVHAGDLVLRYRADHLVPSVSTADASADAAHPGPFHALAAIGNRVRTADGRPLGVVAGKRGGLAPGFLGPHIVGVEAAAARAATVVPGDRVVLEASGRGLSLVDAPEVILANLSPAALDAMPIELNDRRLTCLVRLTLSSVTAAAGIGSDPWVGDLEIDDGGAGVLPDDLRFGDLLAFDGIDATTTRYRRDGYVTIGLVSHGSSPQAGHGVGVTVLLSGPSARLEPVSSMDGTLGPWLRDAGDRLGHEIESAVLELPAP